MFASLFSSRKRPKADLFAEFTPEEIAQIIKNLNDPEQLMTVEEVIAELEAEADQTEQPEVLPI